MMEKHKKIKREVVIIFKEGNTKTIEVFSNDLNDMEIFKKVLETSKNVREVRY